MSSMQKNASTKVVPERSTSSSGGGCSATEKSFRNKQKHYEHTHQGEPPDTYWKYFLCTFSCTCGDINNISCTCKVSKNIKCTKIEEKKFLSLTSPIFEEYEY